MFGKHTSNMCLKPTTSLLELGLHHETLKIRVSSHIFMVSSLKMYMRPQMSSKLTRCAIFCTLRSGLQSYSPFLACQSVIWESRVILYKNLALVSASLGHLMKALNLFCRAIKMPFWLYPCKSSYALQTKAYSIQVATRVKDMTYKLDKDC